MSDPTIYDIARIVGTSPTGVSRVLSGIYGKRAKKREEILRVANELGYRPNKVARNLVSKRSMLIGCIVSNLHNPVYADYFHIIEGRLGALGYEMILADSGSSLHLERKNIERLLANGIDALLLFPVAEWNVSLATASWEYLSSLSIPYLVFTDIPDWNCNKVCTDQFYAGQELARHLRSLGHSRSIFLCDAEPENLVFQKRFEGFTQFFCKGRKRTSGVELIHTAGDESSWHEEVLTRVQEPAAVTAAVGVNQFQAGMFYRFCRIYGITIPQQVSVVAFGNDIWCNFLDPELTVFRYEHPKIAAAAAEVVVDLLSQASAAEPVVKILQGRLMLRGSTASCTQPGVAGTKR